MNGTTRRSSAPEAAADTSVVDRDGRAPLARTQLVFSLVDAINAMLAYWDEHEICRFANRAYYEWFGVDPVDLIDKMSIRDLLGDAMYAKNEPYIRAAQGGQKQVFERAIPQPSGGYRHSLLTYYPHVVDSVVRGFFVHGADVGVLVRKGDVEYPVKLGPYAFDLEQNAVSLGGNPVELTTREFSLARYRSSRGRAR